MKIKDKSTGEWKTINLRNITDYDNLPVGSVIDFYGDEIPAGYEEDLDTESKSLPIGSIVGFAGANPPLGWLTCDGSSISKTTYKELYEIIGTKYGTGSTEGTFKLPDLRDRVLVGASSNIPLASTGGEKTHTLTVNEMPSHSHGLRGALTGENKAITNSGNDWAQTTTAWTSNTYISNTGGDQAHNNMQPYMGANYIIKCKNEDTSNTVTNGLVVPSLEVYGDNYAPSCDIIRDNCLMKPQLLWVNTQKTTCPAQTITLASEDWDMLEIFFIDWGGNTSYNSRVLSTKVMTGRNAILQCMFKTSSGSNFAGERSITYNNQLSLTIGKALTQMDRTDWYTNGSGDNAWICPIYIIGYKTGIDWSVE